MFRLVIEDRNFDGKFDDADEVANVVFDKTGLWTLASLVRQECNEAKSGDKFEYEDAGVVIECL